MEKTANKRKSERLHCQVPVDGKEGSPFESSRTVDFSKKGIGIISPTNLALNDEIPVALELGEEQEPVFVIGKVKWIDPILGSKSYRIGLCFEKFLSGSKSRLNKYFTSK